MTKLQIVGVCSKCGDDVVEHGNALRCLGCNATVYRSGERPAPKPVINMEETVSQKQFLTEG